LRFALTCAVCGSQEHGRPALAGDDRPSFSLSHSGEVAVVALAPDRVGADVEVVRERRYVDRVARRMFTADEFAHWSALRGPDRLVAFLRAWTAKEAYLKMLGVGLTRALRDVPTREASTWLDWPAGAVTSVVASASGAFRTEDWPVPW
jgi:phosphopantetheinyl transferase